MASQSAEIELTEEMRCANMALAVSLDSSADHRLVHRMRSFGTQCSYTLHASGESSDGQKNHEQWSTSLQAPQKDSVLQ